jgi:hypothetical protein
MQKSATDAAALLLDASATNTPLATETAGPEAKAMDGECR